MNSGPSKRDHTQLLQSLVAICVCPKQFFWQNLLNTHFGSLKFYPEDYFKPDDKPLSSQDNMNLQVDPGREIFFFLDNRFGIS